MWDYENNKKDTVNRKPKSSLYEQLGLTRNTYSRIVSNSSEQPVNLDRIWKQSTCKLGVTGLSREIMTGIERLELHGISKDEWNEYLDLRYPNEKPEAESKTAKYRASKLLEYDKKFKKAFSSLQVNRRASTPIDRLYYFIHTGTTFEDSAPDFEIKELQYALQFVKRWHWEECNPTLRKNVINEMAQQLKLAKIIHEYKGLQEKS